MSVLDFPTTPACIMLFCGGFWVSILLDRLSICAAKHFARCRTMVAAPGQSQSAIVP